MLPIPRLAHLNIPWTYKLKFHGTLRRFVHMKRDLREQQGKLATLLQERGPRITEIARELGESPETVRYWFRHNILGHRGVAYQAVPDFERLGFKRIHAVIDFSDEYLRNARDIL